MSNIKTVTRFFRDVVPPCYILIFLVFVLCGSFFSGCGSLSEKRQAPAQKVEDPVDHRLLNWEILDYRNKDLGGSLPAWVDSYLSGGNQAVEQLAAYSNYYVFVSDHSGTNFNALEHWMAAFSPDLDFAHLVTVRIEKRFFDAASNYPDDEYGAYYEALIRASEDAIWEGAVKDSDFWVLRQFPQADGFMVRDEMYDFLVLVKIEKPLLVSQITTLFQNVQPSSPLSRDQNAAVQRVQDRFFAGF